MPIWYRDKEKKKPKVGELLTKYGRYVPGVGRMVTDWQRAKKAVQTVSNIRERASQSPGWQRISQEAKKGLSQPLGINPVQQFANERAKKIASQISQGGNAEEILQSIFGKNPMYPETAAEEASYQQRMTRVAQNPLVAAAELSIMATMKPTPGQIAPMITAATAKSPKLGYGISTALNLAGADTPTGIVPSYMRSGLGRLFGGGVKRKAVQKATQEAVPAVTKAAQEELPAVKKGYTRLYRYGIQQEDELAEAGRWFTSDLTTAERFGKSTLGSKLRYIDVPNADIAKYQPPDKGSYLYLPKDIASSAKFTESAGPRAAVPPGQPPRIPPTSTGPAPAAGGEEFAGNIRLSKYPEEIRSMMKNWADANPREVQNARRGIRSDAQVLEDAKKLAEEVGARISEWKPGQARNAEEITVLRGVLRNKSQEVYDLSNKISMGEDTSGNMTRLILALEEQNAVQQAVTGVTAEAGRALRSFRNMASDAINTQNADKMAEILKRLGGAGKTKKIAKLLSQINIDNPAEVNNFIRNVLKPKWGDYVVEIFYNSILSNPKTHLVNFGSNMLSSTLRPFETTTAAAIEVPLSILGRRQRQRFFGEAAQEVFGVVRGVPEGFRGAWRIIKTGIPVEEAAKWEQKTRAFKGKAGLAVGLPGRMLEAADAFGFSLNRMATLRKEAYRAASIKKLKGQAFIDELNNLMVNPTKEMLENASKEAEYRLFRQEPGEFVKKLIKLRDANIFGIEPLRFVVPFLRTPANLVKYGLERSPLAIFNVPMWKNVMLRNPHASDQIARWVLGSGMAAGLAYYVADGKITGPAPRYSAERDAFYREGKQPYSIKIGDKWVSYQRIEPFNQAISQVAAVIEAINDEETENTVIEKGAQAVATIMQNFISQTYMSGIANIIQAIEDPEGSGAYMLQGLASGLVPYSGALRGVTQAMDPTIRSARNIPEAIYKEIPGMTERVREKRNVFGEVQVRETPFFSPINISIEDKDPVNIELKRLGINIGNPSRMIGTTKLDDNQYYNYQIIVGQTIKKALDEAIKTTKYKNIKKAEDKADYLDKIIRDSRVEARDVYSEKIGIKTAKKSSTTAPSIYEIPITTSPAIPQGQNKKPAWMEVLPKK